MDRVVISSCERFLHLLEYGPQTLPTEELLALVLRTNAAQQQGIELVQRLLAKYGSLGGLVRTDCRELACEPGLGEASIALIKAMLELGRRLNKPQIEEKYQIRSPADAANLVIVEFTSRDSEDRPMCTCELVAENWLESFVVMCCYHEVVGGRAMNVTQLMVDGSASGSIAMRMRGVSSSTAASALLEQP